MLDTAVIPCGGLGRRLQPITRWLPKEMLPVALKPLLYWALDEAADAGLLRVVIVTNPHKPMVEAAARHYQGPLELEFVPQPQPRGVAHAIQCARDALAGSPFALILTDQLFSGANPTTAVLAAHRAARRPAVLAHRVSDLVGSPKSLVEEVTTAPADDGTLRVTRLTEHAFGRGPDGGKLAASGRVVLPGDIFAAIDEVERSLTAWAELGLAPVLRRLADHDQLAAAVHAGKRFDIAVPEGYHAAVAHFPPQT